MFEDPPGCFMHRQASFITAFFPEDSEAGVDYDWFPMPGESQQPTLFAGELAVVFSNRPEVVDFLEQFMGEEVQCAMGTEPEARGSPRTSTSVRTATPNPILADASEVLTAALPGGGRRIRRLGPDAAAGRIGIVLDGDDGYMQDGPDSLQTHLENIEASWPRSRADRRPMDAGRGAAACGRSRLVPAGGEGG